MTLGVKVKYQLMDTDKGGQSPILVTTITLDKLTKREYESFSTITKK